MRKLTSWTFYTLFFVIPLLMYLSTSEIFEFNKIILLYLCTAGITASWIAQMILEKRVIFRKTKLDIPLLIFLGTQGISTILSIDFHTSLLGYYGRFNGGFASILCYALLYWAYVSTMNKRTTIKSIYCLLFSSFLVSLYAILQHFGIDKDVWTQDVQTRVFSTLGQPNWLAAWVVTLMPIVWAIALKSKIQMTNDKRGNKNHIFLSISLSILLFTTFLFTRSRSGLLGFGIAFCVFWILIFFQTKRFTLNLKPFFLHCFLFFVLCLFIGTPWTPSIQQFISSKHNQIIKSLQMTSGTQLESGGTESGEIRKIVWKGAIEIWKNYPIIGSGVETFAFTYYQFKPEEHNYTSEWDYLYNKAHNEYLNYLSTTGIIGLLAYLFLIFTSIVQILNFQFPISNFQSIRKLSKSKSSPVIARHEAISIYNVAFLSGYVSILVTNFFGFSVVPVSLLFFLFPAMAVSLRTENIDETKAKNINASQKVGVFIILLLFFIVFSHIARYWYADTLYLTGKRQNDMQDSTNAQETLIQATKYSPNEAIFWDELAEADRNIAVLLSEKNKPDEAKKFAQYAIQESIHATDLSSANVNLKRNRAALFTKLSGIDPNLLNYANTILIDAVKMAPTDPKLQYALAASYYRLGQIDTAIFEMKKAVEMKKDYKDSRFALAMMYVDAKKFDEAKKELQYILEKIDGKDEQVKKELEELNKNQ